MTTRALALASAVLAASVTVGAAAPPTTDEILAGVLEAAGGAEAFAELGVLEIVVDEEETLTDGTRRTKRFTAYIDTANLSNLRLELPGDIVVARNGTVAWATRSGVLDERPQTPKMAVAMLNQRLFPLLMPHALTMQDVRLSKVTETTFDGEPAWRLSIDFPERFFISPAMSTTWSLHVRRSDHAVLAVGFFPPPGVQQVMAEGVQYRVLKQTTVGSAKLPSRVLLDGVDATGAATGHVRVTKLNSSLRGPFEPALFLHPATLEALEEGMQ